MYNNIKNRKCINENSIIAKTKQKHSHDKCNKNHAKADQNGVFCLTNTFLFTKCTR